MCRVAERLTATYVLRVKHDEKEYTLKFPGTKTVREVKNDIYSLTDIPFRYQVGFRHKLYIFKYVSITTQCNTIHFRSELLKDTNPCFSRTVALTKIIHFLLINLLHNCIQNMLNFIVYNKTQSYLLLEIIRSQYGAGILFVGFLRQMPTTLIFLNIFYDELDIFAIDYYSRNPAKSNSM